MHEIEAIRIQLHDARTALTKKLHEYYNSTDAEEKQSIVQEAEELTANVQELLGHEELRLSELLHNNNILADIKRLL